MFFWLVNCIRNVAMVETPHVNVLSVSTDLFCDLSISHMHNSSIPVVTDKGISSLYAVPSAWPAIARMQRLRLDDSCGY